MSKLEIKDLFDELKLENKRLLNELILSQKNIQFLELYRSLCSKIKTSDNLLINKKFNKLEIHYKEFVAEEYQRNNYKFVNDIKMCGNKFVVNCFDPIVSDIQNDLNSDCTDDEVWFEDNNDVNDGVDVSEDGSDYSLTLKHNQKSKRLKSVQKSNESISKQKLGIKKSKLGLNSKQNTNKTIERELESKNCEKTNDENKTVKNILKHKHLCKVKGCKAFFKNNSLLEMHEKRHSDETQIQCEFSGCEKLFRNKHLLKRHHYRVHSSVRKVSDIRKKEDIYELIKSEDIVVKNETETKIRVFFKPNESTGKLTSLAFGCDWDWNTCQYISCNRKAIVNHIKSHDLTEKPTKRISNRRIERNIKILSCDWPACEQTFCNHIQLLKHKTIHSDNKSLNTNRTGSEAELEYQNKLNTDYPYVCQWPECSQRYKTADFLKTHRLIHTGEKSYECDQCGQKFAKSFCLKIHLEKCVKQENK